MTTPNYIPSYTVDNVMDAIIAFMTPFMPQDGKIVRSETNRVPLPPAPCAVLTELFETDLSVPYDIFNSAGELTAINAPTKIEVQIDFYGEIAGDICKAVKQAFRTEWGFSQFPLGIKPLFTDDARQMPLTTGEDQYLRRWTLTASLQYNPVVTVPQQSATVVEPSVHPPVDFPVI